MKNIILYSKVMRMCINKYSIIEVKVSVMSRPCTYNKELENASFM